MVRDALEDAVQTVQERTTPVITFMGLATWAVTLAIGMVYARKVESRSNPKR